MASWITDPQVQQWLEATRMPSAAVDVALERTSQAIIKAKLAARYDTSTWLTPSTTPELIQAIASMYNAGFQYQVQFGQDVAGYAGQENWGQRLISIADNLLTELETGITELPGVDGIALSTGQPLFWPTDLTGTEDPDFDIKFSMGRVF